MRVLLDTNLLTRSAEPADPQHRVAVDAVSALRKRGDEPCLVPQNLYEFWVVSTREIAKNGRGLTPGQVAAELNSLKALFTFLPDTPDVFTEWEKLATAYKVIGKNARDARFVAATLAHGVSHLATFNDLDFRRYTGIVVLEPAALAASLSPTGGGPSTPYLWLLTLTALEELPWTRCYSGCRGRPGVRRTSPGWSTTSGW
jgi:predicted nucleic acid-binding protein